MASQSAPKQSVVEKGLQSGIDFKPGRQSRLSTGVSRIGGKSRQQSPVPSMDTSSTMDSKGRGRRIRRVTYDSDAQRVVHDVISHVYYELALCLVVIVNIALMVVDVNHTRSCGQDSECFPPWLDAADLIFLSIYAIDMALSIFAYRWSFFEVGMNLLDLASVIIGIVDVIVSETLGGYLSLIKMMRLARLLRVVKIIKRVDELNELVVGFFATQRAMFWGLVMILLLCVVWSIVILQSYDMLGRDDLFNDARFDAYWCEDAMSSTQNMMLLLWQILITGDSWGSCTLPIILHNPLMAIVYGLAHVCVSIGFQNLILAVIVERAGQRTEEDKIFELLKENKINESEIERYQSMFYEMDDDSSGMLSLPEFLAGLDDDIEFQYSLLMKFGIDSSDLADIMRCFDREDTHEVKYEDFTQALFRSQRQKKNTQLMMIQAQLTKLMSLSAKIERRLDLANVPKPTSSAFSQAPQRSCVRPTSFPNVRATGSRDPGNVASIRNMRDNTTQRNRFEGTKNNIFPDCNDPDNMASASEPTVQNQLLGGEKYQLDDLETRLQRISMALENQSLALADETRLLSSTLMKLQAVKAPAQDYPIVGRTEFALDEHFQEKLEDDDMQL